MDGEAEAVDFEIAMEEGAVETGAGRDEHAEPVEHEKAQGAQGVKDCGPAELEALAQSSDGEEEEDDERRQQDGLVIVNDDDDDDDDDDQPYEVAIKKRRDQGDGGMTNVLLVMVAQLVFACVQGILVLGWIVERSSEALVWLVDTGMLLLWQPHPS